MPQELAAVLHASYSPRDWTVLVGQEIQTEFGDRLIPVTAFTDSANKHFEQDTKLNANDDMFFVWLASCGVHKDERLQTIKSEARSLLNRAASSYENDTVNTRL